MLLASGDVRLIRVWDVQREMKVQVYLRVYSAYLCHNYMENVTRGFVRLGEGSCRSVKYVMLCAIWYRTYDFKKFEIHPWKSVTFSNATETWNFTKSNIPQ